MLCMRFNIRPEFKPLSVGLTEQMVFSPSYPVTSHLFISLSHSFILFSRFFPCCLHKLYVLNQVLITFSTFMSNIMCEFVCLIFCKAAWI